MTLFWLMNILSKNIKIYNQACFKKIILPQLLKNFIYDSTNR